MDHAHVLLDTTQLEEFTDLKKEYLGSILLRNITFTWKRWERVFMDHFRLIERQPYDSTP